MRNASQAGKAALWVLHQTSVVLLDVHLLSGKKIPYIEALTEGLGKDTSHGTFNDPDGDESNGLTATSSITRTTPNFRLHLSPKLLASSSSPIHLHKQKLPRYCPTSQQHQGGPFIGKLVQNRQCKHIKNSSEPRI